MEIFIKKICVKFYELVVKPKEKEKTMAKFKEVMTTENLSDYLDQHARIDVHNGLVYFGCSHCKQEALKKLERILCKKDFEKVKNLDLEFGTLIFNPETHDIMCSSRPNSNYDDTHAL